MKRKLIVICLLAGVVGFSQQIRLKGQASIHNSKYETGEITYVKDVFITAPFTKSSSTDMEGKFELDFVGITSGTSIKLKAEKANLEIVNENDLQQVVISRKQLLRIFLINKGQLAKAQTEFYNISKKALFFEKNALITRLRGDQETSKAAIVDIKKKFGQEISDRFEAEELLNAKIEAQEKNLPQFALDLASQNLDFASGLFIEAYEHFKKGNIEKAIETLDAEKLASNLTQAKSDIIKGKALENIAKETQEKGYLGAEQTINGYNLKAESYALKFNYKNAAQEYEKIIAFYLDPKLEYDENELSQWYGKAATNGLLGKKEQAMANYEKALEIYLKNPEQDVYGLAVTYSNMAVHFSERSDYEKALEYSNKGLQTVEGHLAPEYPIMITLLVGLGSCYSSLKNYEKALEIELKCIALLEKIYDKEHPSLVSAYSNIGSTYSRNRDFKLAIEYQSKVVEIRERILPPKHPDLVLSYNNLANTYYWVKDYKNALQLCEKALVIAEEIYTSDHYVLFDLYTSFLYIYNTQENFERALTYQKKMIEIQERTLDKNSLDLADGYLNVASLYGDIEDFESALKYGNKAISIYKLQLPKDDPLVLSLMNTFGMLEKKT